MKKLLAVILALLVLGAVVPGCGGTHRYDGRLAAVDSLMKDNPDSALALVLALDTADILAEGDRAYRDLLLTQARYKSYVTATSDSVINRALAYFRTHPADREKLTRAYIYKGAVMDELGYPDSAMLYYKHAEATAAPDDYFNLGYCKMRMGALYSNYFAMDGKHIQEFEEALEYFNRTDNQHYQLICMINLGSLYCMNHPQKADSLLNRAISLAKLTKDTSKYVGASQNLIKLYIKKKDFESAYQISQRVINMDCASLSAPFCLYTAFTYAHMMMPDSAQMFIEMLQNIPITSTVDTLTLLETKRDIALARGDTDNSLYFERLAKHIDDSLHSLEQPALILKTENDIDKITEQKAQSSQRSATRWIKALLIILAVIIIGIMLGIIVRRRHQRKQQKHIQLLEQYRKDAESQIKELKLLQQKLQQHDINDETLKELLNTHLKMMIDVVEECYHNGNETQLQRIRDIVQFQKQNKEKWTQLYGYLDMEFNGIISQTRSNYPSLGEKDLLLIAMLTLDFSYIQMAMILGYKNASTMSSTKLRLAKKMRLDISINEYINQFRHS